MAEISRKSNAQVGLDIIARYAEAISHVWVNDCLYRGHANAQWEPVASAFRPNTHGVLTEKSLSSWKQVAQRLAFPKPSDSMEYLVLAQHYGIPTALLDWTSNPLTALFFATLSEERGAPGQVIQVRRDQFTYCEYTLTIPPFAEERERPLLLNTSAMNIRSTAQDSFMSLHVRSEPTFKTTPVFTVPHEDKSKVQSALAIFGLTPERVYADLAIAANRFAEELDFENMFG